MRWLIFGWWCVPVMLATAAAYWLFDNDFEMDAVLRDIRRLYWL
jgi:hypothetical protein